MINEQYTPLIYILLPNKTTDTYTAAFTIIKDFGISPAEIFADFKLAIHQAVQIVRPCAKRKGYRFHLGKCWNSKIQSLGFSTMYCDKDSEIGDFLKLCFGLPSR